MCKLCAVCDRWSPYVLSLLRIVIGALILMHGSQKVLEWPTAKGEPPALYSLPWVAGVIELVGGSLVLLGLGTRFASFILSGEMAVAYFMVHQPRAILPIHNLGELAVIFCFVFFYLVFSGAGPISIDHLIKRSRGEPEAEFNSP